MTPMPPSWAIAIARRASVTVSMAAETTGRFRTMFRLRWVLRLVSRGNTWEYAGTNNTSSKVSALPRRRIEEAPDAKADYTDRRAPLLDGALRGAAGRALSSRKRTRQPVHGCRVGVAFAHCCRAL